MTPRASEIPPIARELASLNGRRARVARWLHLYLSLFSLAALLFFGITGFTLNHADWFAADAESFREIEGRLNPDWVKPDPLAPANPVAKLEIVEALRKNHGIRGVVSSFSEDPHQCVIVFASPGYGANAFVDRVTGHYSLTESRQGFVAIVNDLHKGRDSGAGWSVLIDASALLCTAAGLTGLWLLFYIRRRVKAGLVAASAGALLLWAVYAILVP